MKSNPINDGMIEQNFSGIGEISNEMLNQRAKELALIAGRPMNKIDHEQALRELMGIDPMDPTQALLESASEDERWDPIFGSTGHQAEGFISEDEDEEGQSQSAQLFEEGVSEAEHDQMLQAARAAAQIDFE